MTVINLRTNKVLKKWERIKSYYLEALDYYKVPQEDHGQILGKLKAVFDKFQKVDTSLDFKIGGLESLTKDDATNLRRILRDQGQQFAENSSKLRDMAGVEVCKLLIENYWLKQEVGKQGGPGPRAA